MAVPQGLEFHPAGATRLSQNSGSPYESLRCAPGPTLAPACWEGSEGSTGLEEAEGQPRAQGCKQAEEPPWSKGPIKQLWDSL